jgi:hemoglobin-like flavoprotein
VNHDPVDVAKESYDRCCAAPEFFASFYDQFFAACPIAKPMFARTDFQRQHKLLRHAIGLLFTYARHPEAGPDLLARVAERHSRADLEVDPALYPIFLDSLIETARRFDPEFTDATAAAWRQATAKGIAYMQSRY